MTLEKMAVKVFKKNTVSKMGMEVYRISLQGGVEVITILENGITLQMVSNNNVNSVLTFVT